jgi:hypothetical protein
LFTARYALSHYIRQTRLVLKELTVFSVLLFVSVGNCLLGLGYICIYFTETCHFVFPYSILVRSHLPWIYSNFCSLNCLAAEHKEENGFHSNASHSAAKKRQVSALPRTLLTKITATDTLWAVHNVNTYIPKISKFKGASYHGVEVCGSR